MYCRAVSTQALGKRRSAASVLGFRASAVSAGPAAVRPSWNLPNIRPWARHAVHGSVARVKLAAAAVCAREPDNIITMYVMKKHAPRRAHSERYALRMCNVSQLVSHSLGTSVAVGGVRGEEAEPGRWPDGTGLCSGSFRPFSLTIGLQSICFDFFGSASLLVRKL